MGRIMRDEATRQEIKSKDQLIARLKARTESMEQVLADLRRVFVTLEMSDAICIIDNELKQGACREGNHPGLCSTCNLFLNPEGKCGNDHCKENWAWRL